MAKAAKKKKKGAQRQRRERRFEPRATANPWLVRALGVVGAVAMGAGTWGQFGPALTGSEAEPFKLAPWILAGGAVLVGIAIWFGTSGDAAVRVGDGGIGVEKGSAVRRIAWHALERLELSGSTLRATGKDEADVALTITASLKSQPYAVAWMIEEARARVPEVVHVDERAEVPPARDDAGTLLDIEPIQLVGKHCAESGKVIAYEPDARVCPRCELVYHKDAAPKVCRCGQSMTGGRTVAASAKKEEEDDAVADALASDAAEKPALEEKPEAS